MYKFIFILVLLTGCDIPPGTQYINKDGKIVTAPQPQPYVNKDMHVISPVPECNGNCGV